MTIKLDYIPNLAIKNIAPQSSSTELVQPEQSLRRSAIESWINNLNSSNTQEVPQIGNDRKISIIGAGPVGLILGLLLLKRGYKVDIYDQYHKDIRNQSFLISKHSKKIFKYIGLTTSYINNSSKNKTITKYSNGDISVVIKHLSKALKKKFIESNGNLFTGFKAKRVDLVDSNAKFSFEIQSNGALRNSKHLPFEPNSEYELFSSENKQIIISSGLNNNFVNSLDISYEEVAQKAYGLLFTNSDPSKTPNQHPMTEFEGAENFQARKFSNGNQTYYACNLNKEYADKIKDKPSKLYSSAVTLMGMYGDLDKKTDFSKLTPRVLEISLKRANKSHIQLDSNKSIQLIGDSLAVPNFLTGSGVNTHILCSALFIRTLDTCHELYQKGDIENISSTFSIIYEDDVFRLLREMQERSTNRFHS